jgi:transcriptional regulator with XRE-family HTH domain
MGTTTLHWTLGDRLRKSREHAGFTQKEMADYLHMSRTSVIAWEADEREPTASTVAEWAVITDVDVAWLLSQRYPSAEPVIDLRPVDPDQFVLDLTAIESLGRTGWRELVPC